jgi:hypothetical protein
MRIIHEHTTNTGDDQGLTIIFSEGRDGVGVNIYHHDRREDPYFQEPDAPSSMRGLRISGIGTLNTGIGPETTR